MLIVDVQIAFQDFVVSLLGVNCLCFSFIILLCLHAEVQASELCSASFLITLAKCNTC